MPQVTSRTEDARSQLASLRRAIGLLGLVGSSPTLGDFRRIQGVKVPPPAPASNLSEILAYGFWMRREGYRPSTIQAAISALKAIAKHANLLHPDAVKTHLASRKVSLGRKAKICEDLA